MVYSYSQLDTAARDFLHSIERFDPIMGSIFRTMYRTGCRFHEVKDLSRWCKIDNNHFECSTLKKNHNRIFTSQSLDPLLISQLHDNFDMYALTSYSNCLLWFQRLFPYQNIYVGKTKIATHLFRHLYAKKWSRKGLSDVEVQHKMGEKNLVSALSYIRSSITDTPL